MQRSEGGGAFQAIDTLNGKLLCGCDDIHACQVSTIFALRKEQTSGETIIHIAPNNAIILTFRPLFFS